MLTSAILLLIAWLIVLPPVTALNGLGGPPFWSAQALLVLSIAAGITHFARQRRRPEMPDGYAVGELVLMAVFWLMVIGGAGFLSALLGYESNQIRRVERTQADIRAIADAWETRETTMNQYNAAGAAVVIPPSPQFSSETLVFPYTFGSDALQPLLTPTYMRSFPRTDGWGHGWQFATDQRFPRGDAGPARSYVIRSAGANGRFDPIVPGYNTSFDCDIVYSDGTFIAR
jgi:hypothetical protein